MSRAVIAIGAVLALGPGLGSARAIADADEPVDASAAAAEMAVPDQALAATLGAAGGGRVTPGGLRIGGRYLYRMSAEDWFEGQATFTFGSGGEACFRDRDDAFVCEHGRADGFAAEVGGSIRRYLLVRDRYRPYLRAGVAARIVRFGGDGVRGLAVPLTAAGGIRAALTDTLSVGVEGALELGIGWFNKGLGTEPQIGLAIAALVEFAL